MQTGLYALYASKTHLCMLCEDTTPKKTAYNAYKKTVWLRSRAEMLKMYVVGDAYKVHTSEHEHIRRVKREKFFLLFLLYTACFYIFNCPRFQAFIFYYSRLRAFTDPIKNLIARFLGSQLSSHSAIIANCHPMRLVCIVCIKKPTMHAMRRHNSEKDCIQCIQEDSLAQE